MMISSGSVQISIRRPFALKASALTNWATVIELQDWLTASIRDRSLFLPEGGPKNIGVGHDSFDELKGWHNFFDEMKGGLSFFFFFVLSFSKAVFWIKQFLMKMGNEIAYLMPTKYKIFLGNGALPPYNPRQGISPLDSCEHLAHRLSFPQFKIEWRPCLCLRKWGQAK